MELHAILYEENFRSEWDDFVLNQSVNGTIFHTRKFLSYHPKNKFEDKSIIIREKEKIVSVIAVSKQNNIFFSHSGTTYGGPIIGKKYYRLSKLNDIIILILDFFHGRIGMRIAESIFGTVLNDPIIYLLGKTHIINQELSVFVDLDKGDLITGITSQTLRTGIRRVLRKDYVISQCFENEGYIKFHSIVVSNLKKYSTTPTHSLKEFLQLKDILGDNQILVAGYNNKNEMVCGSWAIKASKQAWHTFYNVQDYSKYERLLLSAVLLKVMIIAKQSNIRYLNFGISTEDNGTIINLKLSDFKESFGGKSINRYILFPK